MTIHPSAQARLDGTLQDTESLRLSVSGGGCSGFRIGMTKSSAPVNAQLDTDHTSADVWISHNVVTDTTSAEFLLGGVLTFEDDEFSPAYKVDIPDSIKCGCGESFQKKTPPERGV
jgi:iron-sulfur cluster assembly accessory protein|tara:strand:+ start:206 stop:553 length:348 start_codon:yes stop_codon:yes gene_type:complete